PRPTVRDEGAAQARRRRAQVRRFGEDRDRAPPRPEAPRQGGEAARDSPERRRAPEVVARLAGGGRGQGPQELTVSMAGGKRPGDRSEDARPDSEATEGIAPRLLRALHLMNADGSVSSDMRRKLKQVVHLVRLFRPVVERLCASDRAPVVWDLN